jgi:hypothetical protein
VRGVTLRDPRMDHARAEPMATPSASAAAGWLAALALVGAAPARAGSLALFANAPAEHDYGLAAVLPPGFGGGEFTFELWVKPDHHFPVGPCVAGAPGQLLNWCSADNVPYGSADWWFEGNFLLDGHNNAGFENGTFSLQFYGGGRVRWLFGDGAGGLPGGHWSVGAFPAATTRSLLDGGWHHVALVRRFVPASSSSLELYVDGALVSSEVSPLRTDMTAWWSGWIGFPSGQAGWFFGAEKQAAIGVLTQYEDFKGLLDEMRFWSRAKGAAEIAATWSGAVSGSEPGLVGWFRFEEGGGPSACDSLAANRCLTLTRMRPGTWSSEGYPVGLVFADGFETGDLSGWALTVP